MIRADDNMPELTDDELLEMAMDDFNAAADDAQYERRNPHANPRCEYCHGTGIVYDMVDYGSTTVQMPSTCECVEDGVSELREYCEWYERQRILASWTDEDIRTMREDGDE